MIARITPAKLRGSIAAIPSKSQAHRMLICAALSDGLVKLHIGAFSEDIDATIRCLNAFGADIRTNGSEVTIDPVNPLRFTPGAVADCGESGSTLRFLLPVAGALSLDVAFRMHGRLASRPLTPLETQLIRGGLTISRPEADLLRVQGRLSPGSYTLPGNISSQYITGMLFALSCLNADSSLEVTGDIESAGYIEMTLRAMQRFDMRPEGSGARYFIRGGSHFHACGNFTVEGDWSNAAFWLCAGAMDGNDLRVTGLDPASAQGDRAITEVLGSMGAGIRFVSDGVQCTGSAARDHTIDASAIPDLVPAVAAFACASGAETIITRAQRLRIKESDRLAAITKTLNALGGDVSETQDGLHIRAKRILNGGVVDAMGDHRIAMMAAVASCACQNEVVITGAQAVNKSYPGFWRDFNALGGRAVLEAEV